VTAYKADVIIKNKEEKTSILIDVAIPAAEKPCKGKQKS
jgi:hypothetical protein